MERVVINHKAIIINYNRDGDAKAFFEGDETRLRERREVWTRWTFQCAGFEKKECPLLWT